MNDLTQAAIHADRNEQRLAICAARNAERLTAWAERWRAKFGTYPPSYGRAQARRQGTHQDPGTADDSTDRKPHQSATVIPHPALLERHGNQGVRHIPRHRGQRIKGRLPGPPEVA